VETLEIIRSTHGFCKIGIPRSVARSSLKTDVWLVAMLCHTLDLHNVGKLLATGNKDLRFLNHSNQFAAVKISNRMLSPPQEFYEFLCLIRPLESSNSPLPLTRLKQAFRQLGHNYCLKPQPGSCRLKMGQREPAATVPPPSDRWYRALADSWSLQRQRRRTI